MAPTGNRMHKALKRHLVPALVQLGFTGTASNFQRLLPEAQDLLTIQYHKDGGSFILECGRRERGPLHTSWGSIVPEETLEVRYLPVMQRARLQELDTISDDLFAGFCFRDFGEDVDRYDQLAKRVAGLLPQIDVWLSTGVKGPHIHMFNQE